MAISYTPSQQQAIDHINGNLQIIACAGSGKTQVLAQRIVNILAKKKKISPKNIVAFTFTEKAAGELKDRVYGLCKDQLGEVLGLADMYVGTIHGFCLELLQTYLYKYLKYSVISEVQHRLLIDRNSKASGLTDLQTHDGQPLKRWQDSRLYQTILTILREAEIDNTQLPASHPTRAALAKYTDLLHKHRYLDYSMILTEAVDALANDNNLRIKIADRIKYLIVDEYQDVNPLQECLIKLLQNLGANLCVVGDDDQTIYQWNGSDIQNIVTFSQRYPKVTQIALDDNFRSSPGVVETAERMVQHNTGRLQKKMRSAGSQIFVNGDLLALDFADPTVEACWIAEKIKAMVGTPFSEKGSQKRGLSWSDCAILLRSVSKTGDPIVEALRQANIPFVVKGMKGLFDTAEVKACVATFAYLVDALPRTEAEAVWQVANLGVTKGKINAAFNWLDQEKADWPNRWKKTDYSLQKTYMGLLEQLNVREAQIPQGGAGHIGRAEIVLYNLGMFSQLIADYETIHFKSACGDLYTGFHGFLTHQATDYYPEGWETAGYQTPDAVQIMTVHQAKGMEFPVVFIPCLQKNRFPSVVAGGRRWSHVIPEVAVKNAVRFKGTEEDERRLFYVALTRSKKYLYCTWAPGSGPRQKNASPFFREVIAAGRSYVLTRDPRVTVAKLTPAPANVDQDILLTFSELRYFFDCPYQFKLRFLYGFTAPLHEEQGYGKSLHDALAEIHRRALDKDYLTDTAVDALLDNHFHIPYASSASHDNMKKKAKETLVRYFEDNGDVLDKIEHSECPVEVKLTDHIVVAGRVDLIRRTDTGQISIIDFKSVQRAQAEDVTRIQLDIYAMGYKALKGQNPDLVEIYNLDEGAAGCKRETVDDALLQKTAGRVHAAGLDIRANQFCKVATCKGCDLKGVCK
jgi:DNA helicase-2/ATP-dependent DNA helicase PcrA